MKTGNSVGVRSAISAQIQLLRSRVEVDVNRPGVVMVTSAHEGDGKNLTARALAAGLQAQGYRTALVGLDPGPLEGGEDWALFDCRNDNAPVVEQLRGNEDGGITPEKLGVFINKMRSEYEYTVVVAGTFLNSAPTMALSRLVDGILLAIRIGRPPSNDDRLMVRLIEQSRSRVIGVVASDPEAAGEFRRPKAEAQAVPPIAVPPAKELAAAASAAPSLQLKKLSRFFRPGF